MVHRRLDLRKKTHHRLASSPEREVRLITETRKSDSLHGPRKLDGCPTFAPAYVGRKRWATRISCHGAPPTSPCAAFIKESRMDCADANKVYRKSGGSPSTALSNQTTKPNVTTQPLNHPHEKQTPSVLSPRTDTYSKPLRSVQIPTPA
jgi:hypothetical protein